MYIYIYTYLYFPGVAEQPNYGGPRVAPEVLTPAAEKLGAKSDFAARPENGRPKETRGTAGPS